MLGFSFYTFCSTSIPFHSLQSIRIGQRDQLNCRLCYLIWMHAPSLQSNPISMNRRNQYGTLLIAENGTVPTRAEFRNRSEVRRLLKVANLFISRWSSDWINGKKNKLQSNYGFPPSLFLGCRYFLFVFCVETSNFWGHFMSTICGLKQVLQLLTLTVVQSASHSPCPERRQRNEKEFCPNPTQHFAAPDK